LVFGTTPSLSINKRVDLATGSVVSQINLDLPGSNFVAKNGIVNSIQSVMRLYKISPVKVTQYCAGAPMDRTLVLTDGTRMSIADFFKTASNANNSVAQSVVWWLKWGYAGTPALSVVSDANWGNDLCLNFKTVTQGYWFEVSTQLMFRGTYNLFLTYTGSRRGTVTISATVAVDGQRLGDMVNLADNLDAFGNLCVGENIPGVTTYWGDNAYKRKIGTVTFNDVMTHKVRIDLIGTDANTNGANWYKVEFEPVL